MKKLFVVLSACFLAFNLFAQTPVDNFVYHPFLKNANISLLIREAGKGKVMGRYNADKSIIPASTLKLVTTASALELLGPDFRFQTKLEISGNITHEHVLQGNVIIKGGGDPTLGSEFLGDKNFLDQWVLAINQAGIDKIEGKLLLMQAFTTKKVSVPSGHGKIWEIIMLPPFSEFRISTILFVCFCVPGRWGLHLSSSALPPICRTW